MAKRTSNKKVKQAIVSVYSERFPFELFEWGYFSNKYSKHFGELVAWTEDKEYPDAIYYGTPISFTAKQMESRK